MQLVEHTLYHELANHYTFRKVDDVYKNPYTKNLSDIMTALKLNLGFIAANAKTSPHKSKNMLFVSMLLTDILL